MRAYDILLFTMGINAALWILTSLGISTVIEGRLILPQVTIGGVVISGEAIIAGIAGAVLVASVTIVGTSVTRPEGVAVVAFSSFYILMFVNGFAIFYEMGVPAAFLGGIGIFNIVVFIAGIKQMVSGGWRTHK